MYNKGKGKVHPRTVHEGPEGEKRYSATRSLTSALDVGGWSTPRPSRFTPGKYPEPVPIILLLLCLLQLSFLDTTYQPNLSLHGAIPLRVKRVSLFLLKLKIVFGKPENSKRARILRLCLHFQNPLNNPRVIKEILLKPGGSLFN